jgi:hypothetical protein
VQVQAQPGGTHSSYRFFVFVFVFALVSSYRAVTRLLLSLRT